MDSQIIFGAIIWPTYVGAVLINGEEPMSDLDYQRGSIAWRNEGDLIVGSATIQVPAGEWGWIIYCHNPFTHNFVSSQRLEQSLYIQGYPGTIQLDRITEDDVKITNQALRVGGLYYGGNFRQVDH